MEDLLELKEWVTLNEAAKYLSGVFKGAVSEADLLQLSLDGHLRLSVHTVNPIYVRHGKVIPIEKARRAEGFPDANGVTHEVILAIEMDEKTALEIGDQVFQIEGVLDIPMFGGDRLHVAHHLQTLIGGPPITSINIDGTFLVDRTRADWFQVQDRFDDDQHEKKEGLVKPFFSRENFYPAAAFPDDAVLVVRPENLFDFASAKRKRHTARKAPPVDDGGKAYVPPALTYHWLRYDTWSPKDALQLLLGVDPRHTVFVDDHPLLSKWPDHFESVVFLDSLNQLTQPDPRISSRWSAQEVENDDTLMGLNVVWQGMRDIWFSGEHPSRAAPGYYVEWAEKKGFSIPWLAAARNDRLFLPQSKSDSEQSRPLGTKERDNFLSTIGGLLSLMLMDTPSGQKQSVFADQAAIIDALEAHFPNVPGLKKRTLEGRFGEAKKKLQSL